MTEQSTNTAYNHLDITAEKRLKLQQSQKQPPDQPRQQQTRITTTQKHTLTNLMLEDALNE